MPNVGCYYYSITYINLELFALFFELNKKKWSAKIVTLPQLLKLAVDLNICVLVYQFAVTSLFLHLFCIQDTLSSRVLGLAAECAREQRYLTSNIQTFVLYNLCKVIIYHHY